MKTLLMLGLALATTLPSQAQLFSRDNLGSAVVGGILGGVIGHNSGRKTAEGIGIGAGTGLLLGALSNDYKRQAVYQPAYSSEPAFYGGNQYRYSTTGAVLGGIAGGVIGHNNGRRTAEGVAIGAASGLVLGSIADQSLRQPANYYQAPAAYRHFPGATHAFRQQHHPHAVPVFVAQPAVVTTPIASGYVVPAATTGTAPIQAQTVIINNYYGGGSQMGAANSLFGR
ncbi:MAG: YMGG-like glycine zipper-containing protein [Limisphaerales bacterium]